MRHKKLLDILKQDHISVQIKVQNTDLWVNVDKVELLSTIRKTRTVSYVGFKNNYSISFY